MLSVKMRKDEWFGFGSDEISWSACVIAYNSADMIV